MTEAEIIAQVRNGIREASPVRVTDEDIIAGISQAIGVLGQVIEAKDKSFYLTRALLTSYTNVFTPPTDCRSIDTVRTLGDNAQDITGATNATPIVITCAGHGYSDGDIVSIFDVGGNTAANGTWQVASAATNTFELLGSVGTAAYTSGGKVFLEPSPSGGDVGFETLEYVDARNASGEDDSKWFSRDKKIIVCDPDFTDDLLVDYRKIPSTLADVPDEYHPGIVGYCVMQLVTIPQPDQPDYASKTTSQQFHSGLWNQTLGYIKSTLSFAHGKVFKGKTGWI